MNIDCSHSLPHCLVCHPRSSSLRLLPPPPDDDDDSLLRLPPLALPPLFHQHKTYITQRAIPPARVARRARRRASERACERVFGAWQAEWQNGRQNGRMAGRMAEWQAGRMAEWQAGRQHCSLRAKQARPSNSWHFPCPSSSSLTLLSWLLAFLF